MRKLTAALLLYRVFSNGAQDFFSPTSKAKAASNLKIITR